MTERRPVGRVVSAGRGGGRHDATRGRRAPATSPALLELQQLAGNRAVTAAVVPVVQRASLALKSGGVISDSAAPNANRRADVLGVQDRMLAAGALTESDVIEDRRTMDARGASTDLLPEDLGKTTAAIAKVEKPDLSEPAAKKVLKVDLVAGVGDGQKNDPADVDLVLNLLHEEWHVTNAEYDRGIVALAGTGSAIDVNTLPGFVAGVGKLKKYYVAGYPFRGTTAKRTKMLVAEGTSEYQKALEYNQAGREQMIAWLKEASAQSKDLLLRNSAQWLLDGRSKVYCATKTHDAAARVKAESKPARFTAYFGVEAGAITETQVPYVRKFKGQTTFDKANVKVSPQYGGWESAGQIGVVDPVAAGKAYFLDTVRHEAQHGADHTAETDEGHFKSEMNARAVEERFKAYSTKGRVEQLGYSWTPRQFAMFYDIWSNNDLYPYLQKNWYQTDKGKRKAWREMCVNYRTPQTFNPINSIRIEELHVAMKACTIRDCQADDALLDQGKTPVNAKAGAVRSAIRALDELDRKTIKNNMELNQLALLNISGRLRDDYFRL